MTDPDHAAPNPIPAADDNAGGSDQQGTPDLVEKVTHEVDTDDMFVQGGA